MKIIEQAGCTKRRDRATIAFDDHSRGVGAPSRSVFGWGGVGGVLGGGGA